MNQQRFGLQYLMHRAVDLHRNDEIGITNRLREKKRAEYIITYSHTHTPKGFCKTDTWKVGDMLYTVNTVVVTLTNSGGRPCAYNAQRYRINRDKNNTKCVITDVIQWIIQHINIILLETIRMRSTLHSKTSQNAGLFKAEFKTVHALELFASWTVLTFV